MLFTDPVFLFLLLPVACVLFYGVTPRLGPTVGLALLLVVSLLFYWTWGTYYLVLLILSFTANFGAACIILLTPDKQAPLRRAALYLGQFYNFGTLVWFKYHFLLFLLRATQRDFSLIDAAIPIGISFYTFQQAIFLVDAYHRETSVVLYMGNMRTFWGKLRGYVRHAFFVSFFPHLVIGPIVYLREFQPQIDGGSFGRLRRVNLEVGAALIILGLFKKMVIADHLAPIANNVFAAAGSMGAEGQVAAPVAWLGVLAYYAQLYFDFSGYSDLALGSARMLGIRFPMNFYSPLKAVGIVDFYRRWHITLTRVIGRFVYTPLSLQGTRVAVRSRWPKLPANIVSLWLPLLVNFEMIALWHGARLNFIVFGAVHGVWYVAETAIRGGGTFKAWCKRTSPRTRGVLGRALFLLLMPLTFALFRAAAIPDFWHLLKCMFSGNIALPHLKDAAEVLGAMAIIWLLPNSMQLLARYRAAIPTYANKDYTPQALRFRWRPDWYWTGLMTAMLVLCLYYITLQPPFLYMGF